MSTSAFSSPDEDVIARSVDNTKQQPTPLDQISTVYEIDRSVKWINDGNYRVVALQFPDELMCDSTKVLKNLECNTTASIIILGDTSYGSCCVDEVAAQHYEADCIIHYGRSCLSATKRLPVLYVFRQLPLDISDLTQQFYKLLPDIEAKVVILYDTSYSCMADTIASVLNSKYSNIVISRLNIPSRTVTEPLEFPKYDCQYAKDSKPSSVIQEDNSCTDSEYNQTISKCGRTITLANTQRVEDYDMFFIGKESLTLSNLMMAFNKCAFWSYDPDTKVGRKEGLNINKALMKRYYMIEIAKDARIVGIVVGTLGVTDYLEIIDRLKFLIKAAGKKSYTFVVGKLNVPKLANFMEVDVFVLVACHENTLLDSSEFYKPIITPYEMELACNADREWTGEYVTDFRSLLPGGQYFVEMSKKSGNGENTDVSLVTGRMRVLGVTETPEISSAVAVRNNAMTVATLSADSAGEYLSSRSWKGLDQQFGETPVTKAVEGRKGIASGYSHEMQNN